jgi:hypothetical protein
MNTFMAHLIVGLLYQIPEGILLMFTGLGLLGITKPRRKILGLGLVLGLLTLGIRNVHIPLGFHVPILWATACIITKYTMRISVSTAATSVMLPFFILSLGEQLLLYPLMTMWNTTFNSIYGNPWQTVLWAWLSASFLVLSALAVTMGFVLIPAPEIRAQVD